VAWLLSLLLPLDRLGELPPLVVFFVLDVDVDVDVVVDWAESAA
jgi:hypothetical protein